MLAVDIHVYLSTSGYACGVDLQIFSPNISTLIPSTPAASTQEVACCAEAVTSADKRLFLSDDRSGIQAGTLITYTIQYKSGGAANACTNLLSIGPLRVVLTEVPPI